MLCQMFIQCLDCWLADPRMARWSSVGVFTCGVTEASCKPALVVQIDGKLNGRAQADWQGLERELRRVLAEDGLERLDVEFAFRRIVMDEE